MSGTPVYTDKRVAQSLCHSRASCLKPFYTDAVFRLLNLVAATAIQAIQYLSVVLRRIHGMRDTSKLCFGQLCSI